VEYIMAGVFDKNKNPGDSKKPGELGFEYGTSEMLTAQDLTDGVYEDPHDLRHMASDFPSNRVCTLFILDCIKLTIFI
jgi:hypothetical protein